jgi:ABC-2 type transport system ATP-binding protein
VVLSSHVLSEVERVCDRIAVLRKGQLAVVAPVAELRHLAPRRVTVIFNADVAAADHASLPPDVTAVARDARRWSLTVRGPLGPLVSHLATLPVADLIVEEPALEDVVLNYYREKVS